MTIESSEKLRTALSLLHELVLSAERDRTQSRAQNLRRSRYLRSEIRHEKARLLRFEHFDKEPLVVVVK